MITPNQSFEYLRPDEVAECWDGVPQDLYNALWELPNPPLPNMEDTGPMDHIGTNALALVWHLLTPEHQQLLNRLAEQNE